MNKLWYVIITFLLLTLAGLVYAAPTYNYSRTILPEVDSTYELGSDSLSWLKVFSDEYCLQGDCITAWPVGGGGGGAGGGWSTSTPNIISTNWLSTTNALVGINSSTPKGILVVKGISGTTTPVLLVTSSTNATLFRVDGNGSTTIPSLGAGLVRSTSGGALYTDSTTYLSAAIQNLWGLTNSSINIATNTDTNITFSVSTSSGLTTFTPGWTGVLSIARGGTATTSAPTVAGQLLTSHGTSWGVANLVAGSNITITTSTLGQITITGAAGGSGNSAWTIGNGLIYNATSTDLVGIGTITPTTTLFVQGKGGTNPFAIASSTGTQLLTVTQEGNVGIGTTIPATLLHLYSSGVPYLSLSNNSNSSTTLKNLFIANYNSGLLIGQSGLGMNTTSSMVRISNTTNHDINIGAGTGPKIEYAPTSENPAILSYSFPQTFVGWKAGAAYVGSSTVTSAFSGGSYGNSGFGANALENMTTGCENTAIGNFALQSLTTGCGNTAVGLDAGRALVTDTRNTIIGNDSFVTGTGSNNATLGWVAGKDVTGDYNTFIGSSNYNSADPISASKNTAVGYGIADFTGTSANNVIIGYQAAMQTTSTNNTIVGYQAGRGTSANSFKNNTQSNNTIFGYQAGYDYTTASNNILLGYQAGYNLSTGNNNIVIGYNTVLPNPTDSSKMTIANLLYATNLTNFSNLASSTSAGQFGIGTSTPAAKLSILASSSDATIPIFLLASSSGSTVLKVNPDGQTVLNNLQLSNVASGTQCLQADGSGNVTGTGSACGSGGGASGGAGWSTSTPNIIYSNYPSSTTTIVGINSSSPIATLAVKGISGSTTPVFVVASSTGTQLVTVTQNGNVGIGTSTPANKFHVSDGTAVVSGMYIGTEAYIGSVSGASNNLRMILAHDTAVFAPSVVMLRSRNTTASPSVVQQGDTIGSVVFQGWDGANRRNAASIESLVDGTPGSSDMPGSLLFNISPDGSATSITRMIIKQAGQIAINTTTPLATLGVQGIASGTLASFAVASSSGTTLFQVTADAQILNCATCRLTIPQGTAPTLSAAGDVAVDTSNGGVFSFYANGRENLNATSTKGAFIESPTASENIVLYHVNQPITITRVTCTILSTVSNAPSWTFSLPHDTTAAGAAANAMTTGQACTSTTTPQNITIGGDLTLAAGEILRATSSAVSNASSTLIQVYFKYDN